MVRRLLAAGVILLTVSACAKPVTPPASKVTAPEETLTTIKLAAFKNQNRVDLDQLIAAFQQKYTECRVEIVQFDMDRAGRGRLEQAAMDGAVDVVPDGAVDTSRRSMVFRALDGFLAQSSLDQARYGQLLEALKLDGRVVELPYTVYPQLLVYNKEMAEAAGVTIPQTGWTWDEFRLALRKLTQGHGETKVWGLDPVHPEDLFQIYLLQKYKVPSWQANYEQLRDTLGFFQTMTNTDQSLPPVTQVEIGASGVGRTINWMSFRSLNQQKAAMTYEMPNALPWLRSGIKVPWEIAPMPTHPGAKPVYHVEPGALGIPYNSPQAEAAWKFVAFAAGPEGAEIVAKWGGIPAYASEGALKAWAAQNPPPVLENFWNATWVTELPPQSPNGYGMRQVEAHKALFSVLSGQKSVEDAIGYFKNL